MGRALALVVDRDPEVRAVILEVLEQRGIIGLGAASGGEAAEALKHRAVQLIVVDTGDPGVVARGLVEHAMLLEPAPVIVGVQPDGVSDQAERLLEAGVFDVLSRPLEVSQVRRVTLGAQRELELRDQLSRLRHDLQTREGDRGLGGHSSGIESRRQQLLRLAAVELPVWFHGEEGTGKELAARMLHAYSPRSDGEFVVVDCAAIARSGLERRWLGHGLGPTDEPLWKQAQGGTLFLDEIAELSSEGQQSLLALTTAVAAKPSSSTRFLVGSRRDPRRLVDRGQLAEPLYGRLAENTLSMPPLRERAEDVPLLVRSFLATIIEINHLPPLRMSPDTMALLECYPWPGNIQELRNAVERAVILATEGQIRPSDLPDRVREARANGISTASRRQVASRQFRDVKREVVESFERVYLYGLMEQHSGNVTAAAVQAGMLRSALQRLLRKYGLRSVEFRKRARARHTRVSVPTQVD